MKKIAMYGLAMASLLVTASCSPTIAPQPQVPRATQMATYTGPKQAVPVITGMLTMHPDSICYRGKDKMKYWLFADQRNACLFVTQNENLYPLFSEHLPIALQSTVPAVVMGGVKIDPLVIFTEEQVAEISRTVLIGLNQFDVVKITSYGTVKNLAAARDALTIILNQKNLPETQQPAQQTRTYRQPAPAAPTPKSTVLPNGYDPTKEL